jgi:hypothetical protein
MIVHFVEIFGNIMPRILDARMKLSTIGDSVDTTTAQELI